MAAIIDASAKVALVPDLIAVLEDCLDLLKSADDSLSTFIEKMSAEFQSLIDHDDGLKSQFGSSCLISTFIQCSSS